MSDLFTKAEIENRPKAIKVINYLLKDSWELIETKPEDKTRYDFYIRNKKTGDIIYIEHKDRNYRSDQFPDWQLDGKKYNYLKQTYKRVYYINTFTDGKYAIWDLNAPIGEWRVSQPHKRFSVLNSQMIQTKDIYFKLNNALFLGSYEN